VLLNALLAFLLRGGHQTWQIAPAKYFRLYVILRERKLKALNHVSVLLRNLTVAFGCNVCISALLLNILKYRFENHIPLELNGKTEYCKN